MQQRRFSQEELDDVGPMPRLPDLPVAGNVSDRDPLVLRVPYDDRHGA